MHPKICTIGPLTIYSYGAMLALGFAVACALAVREARRQKINPELIYNLSLLALFAGIIGARIFYVLENLSYYLKSPLDILSLQQGGLSWFGGLILGSVSVLVYLKRKNLAVYKILDLLVPFLALAQAFGRIGCFLNGCCYGKLSKIGFYFPAHDAVLIPTQIYSSAALILIFFILRYLQLREHKIGQIFYTYLILYSFKRFFIEFWRADNPVVAFGLTLFQVMSIFLFCFALIKLLLLKKEKTDAGI